ncbi:ABC-three component system middle component 2 [Streptomyces tropicalis]|uniref:Threonine transporter n=1 Tax=Streptomyces tropicalis TaxID=3034234 RepID=A0ABT6A8X7_9ACTN|nr:ABC-three component system middle component 2 [Streptomyces tropicalis]MDF3300903.1 threonine transporter [Streptomyces tropicalis]
MNPLNSAVEVAMRALVLLTQSHPEPLDLSSLVVLDHAMLHSEQFNGPPSLHPPLPAQPGELGMRRQLLHDGLAVLMRAELASVDATAQGLVYRATDRGSSFLGILEAPYVGQLQERALWAVEQYAPHTDPRLATRGFTMQWYEEFTVSMRDLGGSDA